MRPVRFRWALFAAGAVSIAGAAAPRAPQPLPYERSSHATAAAMAIRALGLVPDRPTTALIADLEGQMYTCDCPADLNYWDLAKGLRTWAALNGVPLDTHSRVAKSTQASERITLAEVQRALAAGAAVIATLAACPGSDTSAEAAFRCQQRVSVLITGTDARAGRLSLLIPDRLPAKERDYLTAGGARLGKAQGGAVVGSLPFPPPSGNVTLTLLTTPR